MTLATGGIGGGVFSDNITVRHLMNVKRVAWGVREWAGAEPSQTQSSAGSSAGAGYTNAQLEEIVRRVMAELKTG
jgi:acetaldehyde dehydrogenase (acetylating)